MEEFGITADDLAVALADAKAEENNARYRSATGDAWSGEGEMPQWLRQAVSAGQSLKHFELARTPESAAPRPKMVDWKDDPFAGSPLAHPNNR
jgi:DNA-binding protein H-NS